MDVSLIVGWVLGIALIIYGIGMEKLMNFVDMPSVIIVVGGTAAALIASFPFKTLAQIPKHIGIMISSNRYNSEAVIHTLVDMAKTARKKRDFWFWKNRLPPSRILF